MSNVTENLYLEQEKLNTFTRTDVTIIASRLAQVGAVSNTTIWGRGGGRGQ